MIRCVARHLGVHAAVAQHARDRGSNRPSNAHSRTEITSIYIYIDKLSCYLIHVCVRVGACVHSIIAITRLSGHVIEQREALQRPSRELARGHDVVVPSTQIKGKASDDKHGGNNLSIHASFVRSISRSIGWLSPVHASRSPRSIRMEPKWSWSRLARTV